MTDEHDTAAQRDRILRQYGGEYAEVALANLGREFPSHQSYLWQAPDDVLLRPRDRTPVFYGSYDWHSCVEMHWLLVRLLRTAADIIPAATIAAELDRFYDVVALAAEARFIGDRHNRNRERPYGWGWGLALVDEIEAWDDPQAATWAERFAPLATALTTNFLEWLPKATYPVRYGVHGNSAFGLSLALPFARRRAATGDTDLLDAISRAGHRWFGADAAYPGAWEPSGTDFLSPALVEAEFMARLLPAADFVPWLDGFLPDLAAAEPAALFTPAVVSDPTDGHIAHLHGLNASRAWCWRRLAEVLPTGDPRVEPAVAAMWRHADAALPHVVGSDYMVEHWLACYAVLLLS